ncbi:hypothetical protein C1752_02694 [Acaryochloris thomasi RCC1774]|uniref:Prepilin-type N-terminal cleavage/methylation domain-containing protein n=1 Tax=Acaryochloris thomasi RCC1774 TaxID=1764569 RepID=A0A2W1JT61_9CYAN|nr:prepilin-type N-terminal cleavage/methylation domain-containing protein [Acaryochloris thomasi]PZD73064.1 hypothetical protein C1752_02694 [Acaryochloris thomasi RCC1774]
MDKLILALSLRQKKRMEQGFTLVEVLVGVLLTLTFVGISTQAFVVSAMFKVRGQELSEATTWMQQDAENIRFEASRLNISSGVPQETEHSNRCSAGNAAAGYADLLRDDILIKEGDSETGDSVSPQDLDRESAMGQRPYVLRRVMSPATTAPFNVLSVSYAVYAEGEEPIDDTDTMDAAAIATSYSEIIPNASFACE